MIKSVCALGFFDGVHKAHSFILSECVRYAKQHGLKSVALTFEKSPAEFFGKEIKYLTPLAVKEKLMKDLGIDEVVILPCDEKMLSLSPEEFVKAILIDKLNASALFCGFNYTFGKNASGNTETLKRLGKEYNIDIFVTEQLVDSGMTVSSSQIRSALSKGEILVANRLLARPFELYARVSPGKKLGRTMGFPTVNIYPDEHFPQIPHGVYATKTLIDDREYFSVTNVGTNPTVGDKGLRVETYIFDFSEDVYERLISVKFFSFLRPEKKFSSVEDLKKQIEKDKENTKIYFESLH